MSTRLDRSQIIVILGASCYDRRAMYDESTLEHVLRPGRTIPKSAPRPGSRDHGCRASATPCTLPHERWFHQHFGSCRVCYLHQAAGPHGWCCSRTAIHPSELLRCYRRSRFLALLALVSYIRIGTSSSLLIWPISILFAR